MRTDTQRLARLTNLNDKVIGLATDTDVFSGQPFQAHHIKLVRSTFVVSIVVDDVLPRTLTEDISVRAYTALKRIVARATVEGVVTFATGESVIACSAQ